MQSDNSPANVSSQTVEAAVDSADSADDGLNGTLLLREDSSLCLADLDEDSVATTEDHPTKHITDDEDLILLGICEHGDGQRKEESVALAKQSSAVSYGRTPRWTPEEVGRQCVQCETRKYYASSAIPSLSITLTSFCCF
jgi:hypothetical protein